MCWNDASTCFRKSTEVITCVLMLNITDHQSIFLKQNTFYWPYHTPEFPIFTPNTSCMVYSTQRQTKVSFLIKGRSCQRRDMLNFNVKHHLPPNVQQLFVLFMATQTNNVAKRGSGEKQKAWIPSSARRRRPTSSASEAIFRKGKRGEASASHMTLKRPLKSLVYMKKSDPSFSVTKDFWGGGGGCVKKESQGRLDRLKGETGRRRVSGGRGGGGWGWEREVSGDGSSHSSSELLFSRE